MPPQPLRLRWHVLLLLVAGGMGWFLWSYVGAVLGPQPRYRLSVKHNGVASWSLSGTWLYMGYDKRHEFRHLADGSVAYSMEMPPSSVLSPWQRFETKKNNVLLPTRGLPSGRGMLLADPEKKRHLELKHSATRRYRFAMAPSDEYSAELEYVPVDNLFALRATSWSSVLTVDFESWMSKHFQRELFQLPVLRIYRTSDQSLIREQALPYLLHNLGYPLLLDGERVLISPRFESEGLGKALLHTHKTDAEKTQLSAHMPGLTLINFRTGLVEKQWPDIKSPDMQWIGQDHVLLRTNYQDPTTLWASSRKGGNLRMRILNNKTLSMIELESSPQLMEVTVVPHGDDWNVLYTNYPNQESQCDYALKLISKEGVVKRSMSFRSRIHNPAYTLIPHQDQLCMQVVSDPLVPQWGRWAYQYPWLKRIPLGGRVTNSVLDLASGEKVLSVTGDYYVQTSQDGKHLVLGEYTEEYVNLRVYDLPLPLIAWWTVWLPRAAGVMPLVLWLLLVVRFSRQHSRRVNIPPQEHCGHE